MSKDKDKDKDQGQTPYDALVIPRGLLGRVAIEHRKASGKRPESEPEAHLHATMFQHVNKRYGHLLGLGPGEIGRLRARMIMAGPYAQHDLFVVDDSRATINYPKDHPLSGQCRYTMTKLQDGALVGRLKDDSDHGLAPLPDPVPIGAEDPAKHAQRLELIRARDGKANPKDSESKTDARTEGN